jgi:chromosome segregation ATPase
LDRVAKTLRAAAATSGGRELVKRGRLAEDLEPPGFEALSGLAEGSSRPRDRKPPTGRQRRIDTLRRKKREAEEHSQRTADEARELEREAREADQTATKAKRLAATARKRADAAAAQVQRIDDELTELQS